jgi:hypothetical protein
MSLDTRNMTMLRKEYIKDALGCCFIRFNPSAKDFDIARLMNDVLVACNVKAE